MSLVAMSDWPVFLVGTKEYVHVECTATEELDAQPVTIWIGGIEYAAQWVGDADTTRQARTSSVVDFSDADVFSPGLYFVHSKVTDSPEIPLTPAGFISVQPAA